MKRILLVVLLLVVPFLIALLFRERAVANKWRKQEAEIEKARIEIENDPEWIEIDKWIEERRKARQVNEKADEVIRNYIDDMEEY